MFWLNTITISCSLELSHIVLAVVIMVEYVIVTTNHVSSVSLSVHYSYCNTYLKLRSVMDSIRFSGRKSFI